MGFSKNRNTSEISYMTNISYKATNRSNTLCIARFVNAVNDVCHRNSTVGRFLEVPLSFKYSCAYFVGVVDEKHILTFRLVKKHFQDDK